MEKTIKQLSAEVDYLQRIVVNTMQMLAKTQKGAITFMESHARLELRIAEIEKGFQVQQQDMNTLFTFESEQSDINAELRR